MVMNEGLMWMVVWSLDGLGVASCVLWFDACGTGAERGAKSIWSVLTEVTACKWLDWAIRAYRAGVSGS